MRKFVIICGSFLIVINTAMYFVLDFYNGLNMGLINFSIALTTFAFLFSINSSTFKKYKKGSILMFTTFGLLRVACASRFQEEDSNVNLLFFYLFILSIEALLLVFWYE